MTCCETAFINTTGFRPLCFNSGEKSETHVVGRECRACCSISKFMSPHGRLNANLSRSLLLAKSCVRTLRLCTDFKEFILELAAFGHLDGMEGAAS